MEKVTAVLLLVVLVVGGTATGLIVEFGTTPVSRGGGGPTRAWWSTGFDGCCLEVGANQSIAATPPTVPLHTPTVYVDGAVSVGNWTEYEEGGNATGQCGLSLTTWGPCYVYVGIWTPSAWSTYVAGGPMQPFWCFTDNGAVCSYLTSVDFMTPSLVPLEGQPWEFVIWNQVTYAYGLGVDYSVTVEVSSSTPSP